MELVAYATESMINNIIRQKNLVVNATLTPREIDMDRRRGYNFFVLAGWPVSRFKKRGRKSNA
jgi:hypothetical protein